MQYHQQYQAASPVHEGYDQSPYSPYQQPPPQSSHPGAMSDWNGTVGTSPSERAAREPTIMGIRRKKFWLIVGPLIAIFVIGVAVGLGVGWGHSMAAATTLQGSATPSPTVVTSVVCPANNGSFYDSQGNNKKRFRVACNLDYNSGRGTQDMDDFQTATFEDCLNACAANDACPGRLIRVVLESCCNPAVLVASDPKMRPMELNNNNNNEQDRVHAENWPAGRHVAKGPEPEGQRIAHTTTSATRPQDSTIAVQWQLNLQQSCMLTVT
ncbi:hypothetical protein PG994_011805 [Apiospora phragmitis]|uniref:Apple domain-containing protein n=1 Tax=Apiospora phragmitis TaxID=2905665 RepID=A0ABR1TW31_9PEZI